MEELFKKYYKDKGVVATHIFFYSEQQRKTILDYNPFKGVRKVNGKPYTEMRSRDAESIKSNWSDASVVCVGCVSDIN